MVFPSVAWSAAAFTNSMNRVASTIE